MPTLRSGDRGSAVKSLQLALLNLGIPLPRFGADGAFGNETATALRTFQHWQDIPQTGELDMPTREKLFYAKAQGQQYQPVPQPIPPNSTQGTHRGATWVAVPPEKLRISEQTDRLGHRFTEPNALTAAFLGHQTSDGATFPTSMLASDGRIIRNTQPNGLYEGIYKGKGIPAPTLVVYQDLSVDVVITNDLTTLPKPVRFAVSGFGALPYRIDGFEHYVSSVAYQTYRVGLGYRPETQDVLLMYHPRANAKTFGVYLRELGCSAGITTDSGGSALFRLNGKFIRSTVRRLPAIITW